VSGGRVRRGREGWVKLFFRLGEGAKGQAKLRQPNIRGSLIGN
jgi:hypothetical protein